MTRFRILLSFGVAALGLFLAAAPAQAQGEPIWVSGVTGNDVGGCGGTLASPCRSLRFAIGAAGQNAEIRCLNGVEDVAVVIDKPLTIDCTGAAVSVFSFDGGSGPEVPITVNMSEGSYPNGVVTLRGLTINAQLPFPGPDGIRVTGGGAAVHVENCRILGFAEQGIDFAPSSTVALFVSDTTISNNATGGILVKPTGASSAKVVLDNVRIEDNAVGMLVSGNNTSGTNNLTVRNSTIAGNGGAGLHVVDAGGGATTVSFEGSSSVGNGAQGVVVVGSNATVRMRNSTVTGNVEGIQAASGAKLISHGGNVSAGNQFNNGAFTQTLPQQ